MYLSCRTLWSGIPKTKKTCIRLWYATHQYYIEFQEFDINFLFLFLSCLFLSFPLDRSPKRQQQRAKLGKPYIVGGRKSNEINKQWRLESSYYTFVLFCSVTSSSWPRRRIVTVLLRAIVGSLPFYHHWLATTFTKCFCVNYYRSL